MNPPQRPQRRGFVTAQQPTQQAEKSIPVEEVREAYARVRAWDAGPRNDGAVPLVVGDRTYWAAASTPVTPYTVVLDVPESAEGALAGRSVPATVFAKRAEGVLWAEVPGANGGVLSSMVREAWIRK